MIMDIELTSERLVAQGLGLVNPTGILLLVEAGLPTSSSDHFNLSA